MRKAGKDLQTSNVHFFEGLFEKTMLITEKVGFAHIDADWYDSVKICIERISPVLSPGGIMIFDDYSSYSGCRKAVDEFLSENSHSFRLIRHDKSALITRFRT